MKYEPEQAWKWRLRAEELRTRAESSKDPETRQMYLDMADSWEKKAKDAEKVPFRDEPLREA